ncbi:MAG: hypothetical protein JWQ60_6278, partial [Pseudonocardia sp.]|nr:hypothetical protein [Pseudonocardia sp.]
EMEVGVTDRLTTVALVSDGRKRTVTVRTFGFTVTEKIFPGHGHARWA